MKFLCVECDEAMSLNRAVPPGTNGSITAVFACPACGRQMALLTNAHETEVVRSLGVQLGTPEQRASGCPFGGMLQEMESRQGEEGAIRWTEPALARLAAIPEFVRPMAQQGIEHYAKSEGLREITVDVLDQARSRFGM
ncbi:MAG: PCP reductase family protein [Thermoanaerobaculia bacterium]